MIASEMDIILHIRIEYSQLMNNSIISVMVFAVMERRRSQPDEATSVHAQWRRRLLRCPSQPPKRFRLCVAVSVEGRHVCPCFQNALLKTSTSAGSISHPLLYTPSQNSPFLSLGKLIEIWKS